MLEEAGCEILFLPSITEIYPDGLNQSENYDLGFLETVLEGKYRPGHYQGVCKVVDRLLRKVMPDKLYLGQKDFQQCMVIKKLVELMGMNNSIEIRICDTVREPDGLAMSSRNMRLSPEERKTALTIFNTLSFIKNNFQREDVDQIKQKAINLLNEAGFKVDYVEIADAENLIAITSYNQNQKAVALIAAYLTEVRLIDNLLLN
jgi:pantoate--beta-alanine ligase